MYPPWADLALVFNAHLGIMRGMKKLLWLASAKKNLKAMPDDVQGTFGHALYLAQTGRKHEQAKPLKGFGSVGVLEVVEDSSGGTFRAVYTVKFGEFMCFIASRRRRRVALRRRSLTWT
jgi:phage-related protein